MGSVDAISFVKECLKLDPGQRLSASDLLNHRYFQNFDYFDGELLGM